MKSYALLFALAFASSTAVAETPTLYKGRIDCDKFQKSPDYVLFTYGKEKYEYSSKKPVLSLCEEKDSSSGCTCYVPYLDEKAFSEKEHSYQVITSKNEKIWVTIPVQLDETKRY